MGRCEGACMGGHKSGGRRNGCAGLFWIGWAHCSGNKLTSLALLAALLVQAARLAAVLARHACRSSAWRQSGWCNTVRQQSLMPLSLSAGGKGRAGAGPTDTQWQVPPLPAHGREARQPGARGGHAAHDICKELPRLLRAGRRATAPALTGGERGGGQEGGEKDGAHRFEFGTML